MQRERTSPRDPDIRSYAHPSFPLLPLRVALSSQHLPLRAAAAATFAGGIRCVRSGNKTLSFEALDFNAKRTHLGANTVERGKRNLVELQTEKGEKR